jgi:C_GCAxxG_C_C family probable redox protein
VEVFDVSRSKKETVSAKEANPTAKWPLPFLFSEELDESEIKQRLEKEIEENHKNRMNCAERTLAPIYRAFELDKHTGLPEDVIRLASGFGGGGGATSYGLCGAASGGLMALGLFWGRVDPMDYYDAVGLHTPEEINKNPERSNGFYRIYNSFLSRFEKEFGCLVCRDLIQDFLVPNGSFTTDANLRKQQGTLCKRLTKWTCAQVMALILEGRDKGTTHMEMGQNLFDMK